MFNSVSGSMQQHVYMTAWGLACLSASLAQTESPQVTALSNGAMSTASMPCKQAKTWHGTSQNKLGWVVPSET